MGKQDDNLEIGATSASRLLRIAKRMARIEPKRQVLDAWSDVLDVPTNKRVTLIRAIYETGELPDKVEADIRSINDIEHRLYLGWVPKVRQPFGSLVRFDDNIGAFVQVFKDDMVLNTIEICEDLMKRNLVTEKIIPKSQWDVLLRDVRQSIKSLQALQNELDPSIFRFAMRHLLIVEQSLVDYQIKGMSAAVEGLEHIAGLMTIRDAQMRQVESSKAWPVIRGALMGFAISVQTAASSVLLLEWTSERQLQSQTDAASDYNDDQQATQPSADS